MERTAIPGSGNPIRALPLPQRMRDFSRRVPCAVVLAGILSAILPGILAPEWLLPRMLLPVLLTLAVLFPLGARETLFKVLLPALAASVSLLLAEHANRNEPAALFADFRPETGIEAELLVTEPSVCGKAAKLPNPSMVRCRLIRARFSPGSSWREVNGTVMASFPKDTPPFSYGDRLRAEGILSFPSGSPVPGAFNYGEYLARRGIRCLFRTAAMPEFKGHETSPYSLLLSGRDLLLGRLLSGMDSESDRALTAALLFGCLQGIDSEGRNDFIRSGTIHILTVSGLHIGMFAGALFFLLAFLPFRAKLLTVPFLTLLYTLATGLQMPAFRAFLMLFCWCVLRAFLLRGSGINSVFMACSLLLLWNPFQVRDAGFQYSFLCVIFLVATAPVASQWVRMAFERDSWRPAKTVSPALFLKRKFLFWLWLSLAGCLTAWAASFALTLFYQGISVPFALPANLLVLPLAWVSFLIFCTAIVPCLVIPQTAEFFSPLLALPSAGIARVCDFFAKLDDFTLTAPPLWSIFAGIAALGILYVASNRKVFLASLGLLLFLMFFWCSGLFSPNAPEIAVLYGGRQETPAFALSLPEYRFSVIANPGDFLSAQSAVTYLKQRGHSRLSMLILSEPGRDFAAGAKYIFPKMNVDTLLLPEFRRSSVHAVEAVERGRRSGTRIVFLKKNGEETVFNSQKIKTFSKNNEFSFDISHFDFNIHIRMLARIDGITEMEFADGRNRWSRKWVFPRRKEQSATLFPLENAAAREERNRIE
ncbi:MAG: ComEC family competence protein [Lentisphaerae bacterium ADurb.Bin242]|nr:MAG: ComEC family competence protein [Lentisphaerae bacterium ADurb.Bin242]